MTRPALVGSEGPAVSLDGAKDQQIQVSHIPGADMCMLEVRGKFDLKPTVVYVPYVLLDKIFLGRLALSIDKAEGR